MNPNEDQPDVNNLSAPDDNSRPLMQVSQSEPNLTSENLTQYHVFPNHPSGTQFFQQTNPYLINPNNPAQLTLVRNQYHANPAYPPSTSPRPGIRPQTLESIYAPTYSNVQPNVGMNNPSVPANVVMSDLFAMRSFNTTHPNDTGHYIDPSQGNMTGSVPHSSNVPMSVPPDHMRTAGFTAPSAGSSQVHIDRTSASPHVQSNQPTQIISPNYVVHQQNVSENYGAHPGFIRSGPPIAMNSMGQFILNPMAPGQLNANLIGPGQMTQQPVSPSPMAINRISPSQMRANHMVINQIAGSSMNPAQINTAPMGPNVMVQNQMSPNQQRPSIMDANQVGTGPIVSGAIRTIQVGVGSVGMNTNCISPMATGQPVGSSHLMGSHVSATPITMSTPSVVESNISQPANFQQGETRETGHQSSSQMSGHVNPSMQQGNQQPSVNAVPQVTQQTIQDPAVVQARLNHLATQIQQIQMMITQLSNSNNPQAPAQIQAFNQRLNMLRSMYFQITMNNQQQVQRTPAAMQPHTLIQQPYPNNPNAIALIQQQMLQNQYQNMHINPAQRPNFIQRFPMRMAGQAHNPMMVPPGLARFSGPRPFVPGTTGFPMLGQVRGQLYQDQTRGRRGVKQRRRKHYSSESEEEEEVTTSDAESISQLSVSDQQLDIMEPRRSTRKRVARTYIQELPDESDSEEKKKESVELVQGNPPDLVPFQPNDQVEGKVMLIERILADRVRPADDGEEDSTVSEGIVEEYFIKFKCYSYLHCEWCSTSELKKRDRNAISKIRRYKNKKRDSPFLFVDEDPFNPEYVEIDRILDVKTTPDSINSDQKINCYLVKWCGLAYDESTWEFEDAVDELSVSKFHQRNQLPPPDALSFKQKPTVYTWQKIPKSPTYNNDNVLREYQLEGINWLLYEYYCGTNCILADEMGLGKTIQSIAFLVEIKRVGIRGPFLIIAPLSTIGNWYREFQSWSDFNVVVFHGAASSRNIIHRYELYFRDENGEIVPDICKFEVLITTYEMILSENKFLSSVRWRVAIVDEAHRLKNRKCKLLGSLSNIYTEHRVLLTGTPLQNTLDELLSLLNFLDPARAEALETMISQDGGGRLETNAQVQQIQSVLKPVILRRLKEDVEKNIAPKEETIIEVEMTSIQKKVYRGILERNLSFLTKGTSSTNLPNLMNIMMELRKCCNHPFLNNGVEEKILAEFASNSELDRQTIYRKALIESSGKMVLVDKLLPKLRDSGHKMLIFSQMVRVLDLIEEYLVSHGFAFERIDGGVRGNLRQAAIDRFSKPDSDRSVFLLCTKAGGLGINLTAADTVIIFDSDWNPQNDIQAQARCHRIGQNKAVKVYRLICRKTYEREMFDRASLKLGLDKAVLQDINHDNTDGKNPLPGGRATLSKKDVEELLRRGAYAAVMDEDTEASAQFCSEDIEQILERRSTVIQVAGEVKGSTFAKASFNAEISGEQVDIDDPDFWQKWAKTAKITSGISQNDFIDDKPRIRKQVRSVEDAPGEDVYDYMADLPTRRAVPRSQRTSWFKKECIRVEKFLLIFGWGRWSDIFALCDFKSNMTPFDVEQISKTIVVIAWHSCKNADSTFSDFVEKAIRLSTLKNRNEQDSEDFNYRPYGKRTRKKNRDSRRKNEKSKLCLYQTNSDWKNQDINTLVFDPDYKKHLTQSATKILIRLRLLFYIEYYILRDCKDDVLQGVGIDDLTIPVVPVNRLSLTFPEWWDTTCDRSLFVGTFKHGYENYPAMLSDTQLCFCKHISASSKTISDDSLVRKRGRKRKSAAATSSELNEAEALDPSGAGGNPENSNDSLIKTSDMPNYADLNTYLKRLVMGYWKNRSKTLSKPTKFDSKATKWTKKEEADFYKALTVYGIQYTPNGIIVWDNFRTHGKFDKKDDVSMSLYLDALVRKCLSILNPESRTLSADEGVMSEGVLNYEKSEKVLKFMELFELIRKALRVPDIVTKLQNVPGSSELPEWWTTDSDVDLLKASALYGIDQSDKRIFQDSSLSFQSVIQQCHQTLSSSNEIITGITDVPNSADLSVEVIKSIINWPKFKTILNRLYGLSMYLTTGTWHPSFEIVIDNLIQKSRQLMLASQQPTVQNLDDAATNDPPQLSISINDKSAGTATDLIVDPQTD
ncbi:Chromodomain-helicase-DNA-binding protein 8 [Thelohanellus kitauei]|uniref:Chromodomain-helicase-DNA-binding protein 8 n=1 Tax=Thelohanellus kitauei TaxID=669202 RepID=A0A0C2I918_THEKT|nr:Chromodomain-helicase-DNA-binding protein 8 [Thelohanellus kitauei]